MSLAFLVAFSGLPHPRVNLRYGIKPGKFKYIGETCTACAGTMILEFAGNTILNVTIIVQFLILHSGCSELVGCTQLNLQTERFGLHFGLDYDLW